MTFPGQLVLADWWESQHKLAVESEQELNNANKFRLNVYRLNLDKIKVTW